MNTLTTCKNMKIITIIMRNYFPHTHNCIQNKHTLTPTSLFMASSLRDSLLLSSISFRSSFLQQIQFTLIHFALKPILIQNKCSRTLPIKDRFISHWLTQLWFIRHSWFASGFDLFKLTACCRTVEVTDIQSTQHKHSHADTWPCTLTTALKKAVISLPAKKPQRWQTNKQMNK